MPDDDDDDDDMTGDHDIVPVEPPTVDIALKACSTLRLFLQQQTDVTDILEKLCARQVRYADRLEQALC